MIGLAIFVGIIVLIVLFVIVIAIRNGKTLCAVCPHARRHHVHRGPQIIRTWGFDECTECNFAASPDSMMGAYHKFFEGIWYVTGRSVAGTFTTRLYGTLREAEEIQRYHERRGDTEVSIKERTAWT